MKSRRSAARSHRDACAVSLAKSFERAHRILWLPAALGGLAAVLFASSATAQPRAGARCAGDWGCPRGQACVERNCRPRDAASPKPAPLPASSPKNPAEQKSPPKEAAPSDAVDPSKTPPPASALTRALSAAQAEADAAPPDVDVVVTGSGTVLLGRVERISANTGLTFIPQTGDRTDLPWSEVISVHLGTASQSHAAVVVLKDDSKFSATILEITPLRRVDVQDEHGNLSEVLWNELVALRIGETKPAPHAPAPRPPKPETAPNPEDCSNGDPDVRCKQTSDSNVGLHGLSASLKREKVKRVKVPPSGSVNFGFDANGGGMFGKSMSGGMVGGDIRVSMMGGSQFPDEHGGGWGGIVFEPTAAAFASFMTQSAQSVYYSSETTRYGGSLQTTRVPHAYMQSTSTTVFMGQFTGLLALQFMYFGEMDAETLKQKGIGIRLGGFAGGSMIALDNGAQWSPAYGPVLGLVFPSYNAGTADYSAFELNVMVIPTKEMLIVVGGIGGVL